jgi:type IV pilus assembly protein PilB
VTLATFELPAHRRGGAVPHDIHYEGVPFDRDALAAYESRLGSDRPVVGLVNRLLVEAYRRGASDIHIEPYENEIAVRFRVDGVLSELGSLPLRVRDNVAARVKILANLDIAERRLPQGGRIRVRIRQRDAVRDLDFRVSCLPTLWGEKIVLRLLDQARLLLDMSELGFEASSLARFEAAIARPYGIVLATGPTGSGKTNTLYSALASLNRRETNIMTAEDPVEFHLRGINQVQVRESVGLTFAVALRELLRQDPNVIMVGEIRDYETAEIAVKAALTGHLVLSTLHTNDAPSTVSRLVNMGIEPFLVGTAVHLVQAQRLVRRICDACREAVTDRVEERSLVDAGFPREVLPELRLHRGRGCAACGGSGYKGRVGLYETLEMSDRIRDLVMIGATPIEIRKAALAEGMLTLRMSGLEKIRRGITTLDEVLRETVR